MICNCGHEYPDALGRYGCPNCEGDAMTESKRGGAGRGQGRKPIKEGQDTVTVSLRMTEAQRDKLAPLGGAEWVRQRIDKAKAPNAGIHRPRSGPVE